METCMCNGLITSEQDDNPPLPKRQRMDPDVGRKDRCVQTEPVLLFSCARDLSRFLRLNALLLSRNDACSQTDPNFCSRASSSQTDLESSPELRFSAEDRALLRSIHHRLASPPPPLLPPPSPPTLSTPQRPSPIALKEEPSCSERSPGWDEAPVFSLSDDAQSDSNGVGTPSMSAGRPRLRTHRLFCVPDHRVVEIASFNDVRPTLPCEEFRIAAQVCDSLLKKSCSIGNFGWRLVSTIYRTEEMRDRNYFGNRGKRPLSPRRLHAVEHAYYDYLPNEDPTLCLAEARNAINQGLRNTTHNLTDFAISADLMMERRINDFAMKDPREDVIPI